MLPLVNQNRWSVFLIVSVGVFLSTMDSSMTNVALPFIMRSFGTSLPLTEWVVLIYLLTITVLLLFWGRVADRIGPYRVYRIRIDCESAAIHDLIHCWTSPAQ